MRDNHSEIYPPCHCLFKKLKLHKNHLFWLPIILKLINIQSINSNSVHQSVRAVWFSSFTGTFSHTKHKNSHIKICLLAILGRINCPWMTVVAWKDSKEWELSEDICGIEGAKNCIMLIY